MLTKIQKWGNSLAVRIPQTLAEEIGIEDGTSVKIWVSGGQIHIAHVRDVRYELEDLLNGVTSENLHGEIDMGEA
jgi:antitoxin MazE